MLDYTLLSVDELSRPLLERARDAQKTKTVQLTPIDAVGPGELRSRPFSDAATEISKEIYDAVENHPAYQVNAACLPSPKLRSKLREIVDGVIPCATLEAGGQNSWNPKRDVSYHGIQLVRITDTWTSQHSGTVWMDDKVVQVERSTELCGTQKHLPILAHAVAGDDVGISALKSVVCQCIAENMPIVVKPRHGANSAHVYIWPNPEEVGEEQILASVDVALNTFDKTWEKENWQLGQVPRGVLVQPMYSSMVPTENLSSCSGRALGIAGFHKALELSVHVIFGAVVGGALSSYPSISGLHEMVRFKFGTQRI
eukprot:gnl/MRDRNA2_/MRDRNA2_63843_c0_seq1.p1 gnl/MRDRNA2_/MRDRNA2_63843_c0~~gnl/MRDRNA2_/MRDRNA2_63843_c0_seq1.p1  ORF type:complete len:313 (+),score=57.89 gnl/MRDRNA2_/MRDRNA2_63843_c0_seq1:36-974(+)